MAILAGRRQVASDHSAAIGYLRTLGYLNLLTGKGRKPGALVAVGTNGPFSCPIRFPETWYLRTDLFEEFLDVNGLGGYRNQKYKNVVVAFAAHGRSRV